MKILIFTHKKLLEEYATGHSEPIHALDTSLPLAFSSTEKQQLLDGYIEAVSDIGARNDFSLEWLCHPISEKNDLEPDNLFDQLVQYIAFRKFFANCKNGTAAVVTGSAFLIKNICTFAREGDMPFRVIGGDPNKRGLVRTVGSRVKRLLALTKGFIQCSRSNRQAAAGWNELDKTSAYTVIRTWFDERSLSLLKENKDVYFGKLPDYLLGNVPTTTTRYSADSSPEIPIFPVDGESKPRAHPKRSVRKLLYFGELVDGFEQILPELDRQSQSRTTAPIILGRSLVSGADYIKAVLFRNALGKNVLITVLGEERPIILDTDVSHVMQNYFQHHLSNPHILTNYLSYLAAYKLVKVLKIDTLYMPFENYAWEKLTWFAASQFPGTKVVSFQHAQVAKNATKFFVGKKESERINWPDRIVTPGKVTRDFLVEKNYPPAKTVAGCALRHDYVIPAEKIGRKKNKRILGQLWSFGKSLRLVEFIYAAGLHQSPHDYEVSLNCHPCHPLSKLAPHFSFINDGLFKEPAGGFVESFKTNDIVIYHGTTSCLDALANGVPVINVEFDDFITVDPLFGFDQFRWTVTAPEQLPAVISEIYALSDEEFYRRQHAGFEFVKEYFSPVNSENLEKFLL
ncbi:MAG: hypothetical protein GY765_00180 [bacterium]|nr:hypothetical protein [bacterium]